MEDFPKAKIPTAMQSGINPEIYCKLSVSKKCARLGNECPTVCEPLDDNGEYPVELDHIVPKSLGGRDTIDNVQWLCATKNREKYNHPDVRYQGDLYFDNEIDVSKLRENQNALGYSKVVNEYRKMFEDPTRIYTRFMLLAWMVGAGKTVAMLAIMFGINHVRKELGNGSARRVKKVLWLVHQKTLVRALADELKEELTKYDICKVSPNVETVTHSGAWDFHADIIVSCPQALWDSKVNTLTDERRSQILSEFDVIIVDEAQFAIDHYLSLAQLAPFAFKFAVTATPMNANGDLFCDMDNGRYKDHFVRFSTFGFKAGRQMGIYKELIPFDKGFGKFYIEEHGGDAVVLTGGKESNECDSDNRSSLPRDLATVRNARRLAILTDQTTNYDNHIMVRAGSILEAKNLVKSFENDEYNDVVGVWSGVKGESLGSKKHPWMLSKMNGGRIPTGGKRIVITVDIGQFGINNKYCSIIVWTRPNLSLVELVQRIGRAVRGTGEDDYVRLVWNGAYSEFKDSIKDAVDYILNAHLRMEAFPSMNEISDTLKDITPNPITSRVNPEDRVMIGDLMGNFQLEGLSPEDSMIKAVGVFNKIRKSTPEYAEKVTKFAEMLTTEGGKKKFMHIPQVHEPSSFVKSELAPLEYGIERLCTAVSSGEASKGLDEDLKEIKINRLRDGDELTVAEVKSELMEHDDKVRSLEYVSAYKPIDIARSGKNTNLPFLSYATELSEKYARSFGSNLNAKIAATKVVMKSLSRHFGIKDKNGKFIFSQKIYQPYEKQLADAMMREGERGMVLAKADYLMVLENKDVLSGMYHLYEEEFKKNGDV